MQAAIFQPPPLSRKQLSTDQVRVSVTSLLAARAHSWSCSTTAQAFTQTVQPTSRFQIALDVLLPILDTHIDVRLPMLYACSLGHTLPSFLLACPANTRGIYLVLTIRTSSGIH